MLIKVGLKKDAIWGNQKNREGRDGIAAEKFTDAPSLSGSHK